MRLAFTGTQTGMTQAQRDSFRSLLVTFRVKTLIHGGCIGADIDAHRLAKLLGKKVIVYPSNIINKRGEYTDADIVHTAHPPLERNPLIVQAGEILCATPKWPAKEEQRSGTWATVRLAWMISMPVVIINPDGTLGTGR